MQHGAVFWRVPKYRFVMFEVATPSVCHPSDTATWVRHNRKKTLIFDLRSIQILMENPHHSHASSQAHLSQDSFFWLHILGLLVLIAAGLLFLGMAEDVVSGDQITFVDAQLAAWFHVHATPLFTQFMLVVSNLQGILAMSIYALLFGIFLLRKKQRYWLFALALAVPGGMLLNVMMKQIFNRARPGFTDPLVTLTTYSFPSGHVAGATLFYGVFAAYLIIHISKWRWRIAVVVMAILLVTLVALSRLYLGAHYLSDVLAAAAEGVAWLALCLTITHILWQRRAARLTS
jgi:membrane-associated phospholipid phosphatase